jgi:hypothetical protein
MATNVPGDSLVNELERCWLDLLRMATVWSGGDTGLGSTVFAKVAMTVFTGGDTDRIDHNYYGFLVESVALVASKHLQESPSQRREQQHLLDLVHVLEVAVDPAVVADLSYSLRANVIATESPTALALLDLAPSRIEQLGFYVSRLPLSAEAMDRAAGGNSTSYAMVEASRSLESTARAVCTRGHRCRDRPDWVLEHIAGVLAGIGNGNLEVTPCLMWVVFFRRRRDGELMDGLARRFEFANAPLALSYFPLTDPGWGE